MSRKFTSFGEFGLSDSVLKAVFAMGFEEPTPIQEKTIPILLKGSDLIGQAQTGTGKTAAFGVPIIENLDRDAKGVQALVLAPTRELAVQAAEEFNKLGSYKDIHAIPIYGGTSIERQITALEKGVHVVVGTPGRVLDHIRRKTLHLGSIKVVVLDEADEMLDMGFIEDITSILSSTPVERQTMLFSATMPEQIVNISKRYMRDPEKIVAESKTLTAPKISQIFYEVKHTEKVEALTRLIDTADSGRFLVFSHTKRECDELSHKLKMRGFDVEAMHGDFSQAQREKVLKKFKDNEIDILIATDVAARGLDISDISHVVNYSIPQDPESYVHRIGRTGRAGKAGVAITLVTPRETMQLRLIKKVSKAEITKGKLPTRAEMAGMRMKGIKELITAEMAKPGLDKYVEMAENLFSEFDPAEAMAALVRMRMDAESSAAGERAREEGAAEAERAGAFGDGSARLFISIGKDQSTTPEEIVDAIADKTDVHRDDIKDVNVFDSFTLVKVPAVDAEKVIEMMHESIISERKVDVSQAKTKASTLEGATEGSGGKYAPSGGGGKGGPKKFGGKPGGGKSGQRPGSRGGGNRPGGRTGGGRSGGRGR